MNFRSTHLTVLLGLGLAYPASAQSLSRIGLYLDWDKSPVGMDMDITSDGSLIAFIESRGGGCSSWNYQRLSTIRSDGTDYRVLVGWLDMELLEPLGQETYTNTMTMSGNGEWLAFSLFSKVDLCALYGPIHWFLVEVATGAVQPLTFNGQPVGFVSFTTDGDTVAFKGFDPLLGWGFYRADPADLSGATRFLDVSGWFAAGGQISGDGSTYVWFGSQGAVCPCPASLYTHDFETGIDTLVASPPSGVSVFDISHDGQRLVYCGSGCVAALADGTWSQSLSLLGFAGQSLSSDGEYVLGGDLENLVRAPWGATLPNQVHDLQSGLGSTSAAPSSADASIVPGFDEGKFIPWGLEVWFEHGPVLTTYGYGVADTPLTWDIGSEPGDSFVLFWGLAPAALPLKTWGTLGIDPGFLGLLGLGTVGGPPQNIAQVQALLPTDLALLAPLPLWFQALVETADGHRLTNTTRFTFGIPVPDPFGFPLMAEPPVGPGVAGQALPQPVGPGAVPSWERLRFEDPAVHFAARDAGQVITLPAEH